MKIYIFEPASASNNDIVEASLRLLKKEFPEDGLSICIKGPLGNKNPTLPYLANSDMEKARLFNEFLSKNEALTVWFSRGGYGTSRWVDKISLKATLPKIQEKTFIGFSDLTFLAAKCIKAGLTFLHAPLVSTLTKTSSEARMALYRFLLKTELPGLSGKALTKGACTGRLIGGNLTCLCHTIGTSLEPPWQEAIVFLEECNEDIYRIDRMLTHLEGSGALRKVRGIALGSFTFDKKANENKKLLVDLLKDRLFHLGVPIIYDLPAGHCLNNMPLLLGATYELDANRGILLPKVKKSC